MLLISKQLWIVGHVLSSGLENQQILEALLLKLIYCFCECLDIETTRWHCGHPSCFHAMICISCHACHPQPWDDITLTVLLRWITLTAACITVTPLTASSPLNEKNQRIVSNRPRHREGIRYLYGWVDYEHSNRDRQKVEGVLVKSSWGVKMWREYSSKTAGKQKSFSVILLSSWHN